MIFETVSQPSERNKSGTHLSSPGELEKKRKEKKISAPLTSTSFFKQKQYNWRVKSKLRTISRGLKTKAWILVRNSFHIDLWSKFRPANFFRDRTKFIASSSNRGEEARYRTCTNGSGLSVGSPLLWPWQETQL